MLWAKFGWNWPSGSGEEDENVKSLRQQQRRRRTDKFWSEKLTWAIGSWVKKGNTCTKQKKYDNTVVAKIWGNSTTRNKFDLIE